jgi:retron-type reverse transcriptase
MDFNSRRRLAVVLGYAILSPSSASRTIWETTDEQLERLHAELKSNAYQPLPVRQQLIPKAGQPGKFRPLGIPTV